MKFLRGLFGFFLFLVIVGGIGYIGWTYYFMPQMYQPGNTNANTPQTGQTPTPQGTPGTMPGHNMPGQTTGNVPASTTALQNKDKLNQITATIDQAIDMITMDPYSKITVPGSMDETMDMQSQQPAGNTSITIYPNGTNSVNITPSPGTTAPTAPAAGNAAATAMPGMAMPDMNMQADTNYVYDQSKLEQLHRGIFRLAQGIMLLNQLNDDLTMQAAIIEGSPTYQTYVNQYNQAISNKAKLNNAINLIGEASELVNINPYASTNGYPYNAQVMEQLHRGIYRLAEGMMMASDLNEGFTNQMALAVNNAQAMANGMYNMNYASTPILGNWSQLLSTSNLSYIFNLILVVLVVVLILSIFGAIGSMLKAKPQSRTNKVTQDE